MVINITVPCAAMDLCLLTQGFHLKARHGDTNIELTHSVDGGVLIEPLLTWLLVRNNKRETIVMQATVDTGVLE